MGKMMLETAVERENDVHLLIRMNGARRNVGRATVRCADCATGSSEFGV